MNLRYTALIIMLSNLLFCSSLLAQSPEKMSYQAIIRNNSEQPIVNQTIGVRIAILQGSVSGTPVYTETQTTISDAIGLMNIEIGTGVSSDDFSTINWANGPYFIKSETDITGGTNYSISGISQLLSVPYAFCAKTAETVGSIPETDPVFGASVAGGISAADTASWNHKQDSLFAGTGIDITNNIISRTHSPFYVGKDTLGGIVFYIYTDKYGEQHGYIVSKIDTCAPWQNSWVLVGANSLFDGEFNTALMTDSPIKDWLISNFSTEWYLPAADELGILLMNRFKVDHALAACGGTPLGSDGLAGVCWSSTEDSYGSAVFIQSVHVWFYALDKASNYHARAIKKF